jgi:hypothetical protein
MMKIYVAAPLSGVTNGDRHENIERAVKAGAALLDKGHNPYVPHLTASLDHYTNNDLTYEQWMEFDDEWLACCDAFLYLAPSPGADRELERAKELGLVIYDDINDIEDVPEASL